MSTKLLFVKPV